MKPTKNIHKLSSKLFLNQLQLLIGKIFYTPKIIAIFVCMFPIYIFMLFIRGMFSEHLELAATRFVCRREGMQPRLRVRSSI